MYYLQSRYYDAKICRFISADGYVSTGQGILGNNMFAYCGNNPVNCVDYTGALFVGIEWIFSASQLTALFFNILGKTIKKPSDPVVEHDDQMIRFDYSSNPDYGITTSIYYTYKIYEMGLPDGRTFEGIWFELLGHYVFHKMDVFDLTDRDDVADMGNYENDSNAYIWECIIHGVINGLESWYYGYS